MPKIILRYIIVCILALGPGSAYAAAAPAGTAPNKSSEPAAPLEENGLIAQILGQVDRWNDGFESEVRQINRVILKFPAMLERFGTSFLSESGQALLMRASLLLMAVFTISLVLEWILRRMLAGLRQALISHVNQMDSFTQIPASGAYPPGTASEPSAGAADDALSDRLSAAQHERTGDMRPPVEGAALARSQRDGVDQVDVVKIDAPAHVEPPRAAVEGPSNGIAGQQTQAPSQEKGAGIPPDGAFGTVLRMASIRHWGRLRQLPFAVGVLLLDLLPLALFFFVTAMLLHWLGGSDASLRQMVRSLVGAYVSARAASAVLRFLVAPAGCGIPMLQVSTDIADILYCWLRRIIVTATFGIGLANAAEGLGIGQEERVAFMKIVSLLVHLFAVILIFRLRRPVGALIAAPVHATGPLASARNRLAARWAYFAATLVMGIWVAWALGVQNGFPRLIDFIGVTAGIIIVARIVAILVLGVLGRIFHAQGEAVPPAPANLPETVSARPRADRYYLLAQRIVSCIIGACTAIALLQSWGFDVLGWLTERPIGRNLLSAVLTIAIAVILGTIVWEITNAGVQRRLAIWNAQGETVRAARLRTLLPILRTCLLIVIVLVVGLTALNQIGINTAPLLASASIVGVALGFGSQKLVQDFITGIFLLMENAMQVGDWGDRRRCVRHRGNPFYPHRASARRRWLAAYCTVQLCIDRQQQQPRTRERRHARERKLRHRYWTGNDRAQANRLGATQRSEFQG